MLKKVRAHFYKRMSESRKAHPIYILPTLDGIKVILLNLILLIIGLVYANNYVLLFNFILFCLFLGSMFYTHFNLSGLKLVSCQFPALHVGEQGSLSLHFSTTNAQGHYFIHASFKSNLLKLNDERLTFPLPSGDRTQINLPITGTHRGREVIQSVYVETLFPFNFFRCFTFFRIEQECFVYPEKLNLTLHKEIIIEEFLNEDGEGFYVRDYQIGDSLKRIDWKKLAQTNRWYTRQFQNARPNPILLVMDHTPAEDTLKSICFKIHSLHQNGIKYGIKLTNNVLISPENSAIHLRQCLRELACYET